MSIEVIGSQQFIESIKAEGGAWALMSGNAVYTVKADTGNSLPVWVSELEAENFVVKAKPGEFVPVFVPISNIVNIWLASAQMKIVSVVASPKIEFPSLTYTSGEFLDAFRV